MAQAPFEGPSAAQVTLEPLLQVTIPGQVRSPKNHRLLLMQGRRLRQVPSEAYRAWEQTAFQVLSRAVTGRPEFPYTGPVWVRALAYLHGPPTSWPDLVAVFEAVGDVLQGEWITHRGRRIRPYWAVILNDRQIEAWDGSRRMPVAEPDQARTEVAVFAWQRDDVIKTDNVGRATRLQ